VSVHVGCAECGIEFCVPEGHHRRLRRTHETFYCPSGHSNYYPAETDDEKRIKRLERQRDLARENANYWCEAQNERTLEAADLLRECPLGCGWQSPRHVREHYNFGSAAVRRIRESVAAHLAENHGAEPVEAEAAEEAASP
jgi:hypothetical protein